MEHSFHWTLTKEDIESVLGNTIADEQFLAAVENLKAELPYEAFAFAAWNAYTESVNPTPDSVGFRLSVTFEEVLNTSADDFRAIVKTQTEKMGFAVDRVTISPIAIEGDRIVYLITANKWKVIQ